MKTTAASNRTLYLVTGAAGFLGGTVCRQLVARGDRVRAFVLPGDKAERYVPAEAEICEGDLTDPASLRRFFAVEDDVTVNVIHCASIVTVNPDYSQKVMDVNVGGTKNIIDCCLAVKNVGKLVYVSSTGAIPEQPKGRKIAEVDHFEPERDPDHVRGCYSQSKALATQAVLNAVHERGLNACVVHPSGIMGPEDYAVGETTGTMIKIINGEMPMGIDGTFNLCDVRDLAAGCIAAVDKGRRGECYILGNKAVRFKDFAKLVAEEAGCKAPRLFLPCGVANFVAGITEKRAQKTGMGLATARRMGQKGYALVLAARTPKKLDAAIEELTAAGIKATACRCDISDAGSVQGLAAYAASLGPVTTVLHIAGMSPHMGDAEVIIRGNALGTVHIHDAFYPVIEPGGCLVDTSSMSAYLAPEFIMPKGEFPLASTDREALFRSVCNQQVLCDLVCPARSRAVRRARGAGALGYAGQLRYPDGKA